MPTPLQYSLRVLGSWGRGFFLLLAILGGFSHAEAQGNDFLVTNLFQLRKVVSGNGGTICGFALEGTVLEADSASGLIYLKDSSGAQALEVDLPGPYPEPGQRILLQGTNYLTASEAGVSLGRRSLVDNNGWHGEVRRVTSIELKAGRYPIQVAWFNYLWKGTLNVTYSGPGFGPRQIPNSSLKRGDPAKGWVTGLNYRCYEGVWTRVPSFDSLVPVKVGQAANFNTSVKTREEHVGLAFDGSLDIDKDGLYSFYVVSDDGSQLFLGKTPTHLTILGASEVPNPRRLAIRQLLPEEQGGIWSEVEGEVTFVGRGKTQAELELSSDGTHMRIGVSEATHASPGYLLGAKVRIRGICVDTSSTQQERLADLLVIPNWKNVEVLETASEFAANGKKATISEAMLMDELNTSNLLCLHGKMSLSTSGKLPILEDGTGTVSVELLKAFASSTNEEIECLGRWTRSGSNAVLCEAVWRKLPARERSKSEALPILTTAAQVQQLKREQARMGYKVKLRGVVTWVAENRDCVVLQDSTRGVFVGLEPGWIWDAPRVGEMLEIEGTCAAAEFSPIVVTSKGSRLGVGRLPQPMYPTWDQLISGSTDSQFVEIRGFVTGSYDNHLILLLPGGKIDVEFTPVPVGLTSYLNSVVRIRGCIFAKWDFSTLLVTPDHPLWFGSATICVDTPPPLNPFSAAPLRARELMQYDVQGNLFRRVKISGQVLCDHGATYYLTDGGIGFRFQPTQPVLFEPGDNVEVVGLVELGGASPIIREAIARKTGYSPLLAPENLSFTRTNGNYDATRVWVEGLLVGSKDNGSERLLEMQIGLKRFVARVGAGDKPIAPWPAGSHLRLTGVYSDLGGTYQESRSMNAFELLVSSPADVELVARAPWWTLNRLLTMVALLGAGLALAFFWIRLLQRQVERRTIQLKREIGERERAEQGRAIEQERARIARDLHDDLGSSLTAINMLAMPVRGSEANPQASSDRLHLIADKTRLMVTTLDELVWAVNPKNDTLSGLVEYMASFAEELLLRTEIVCRLELPLDFPAKTVAAETRHNVLLSAREAINNAVRHGRPTEILLQVTLAEEKLKILIQDNGVGFDSTLGSKGNGLSNLQERMHKVNGHCEIRSSTGAGTMVILTLSV